MKIKHITINTSNLTESITFYQKAMGMVISNDLRLTANLPIVFMGNTDDDVMIELIENKEAAYKGEGISIGFHFEDIVNMHERLKKEGFQPTEFISPVPGVQFFFVKDPNGVNLQVI